MKISILNTYFQQWFEAELLQRNIYTLLQKFSLLTFVYLNNIYDILSRYIKQRVWTMKITY